MREISLSILDVAQNSIDAGAKNIEIAVCIDENKVEFSVSDDGKGMDESELKDCKKRGVSFKGSSGLGLALVGEDARASGGRFEIVSKKGLNTKVFASFNGCGADELGNLGATFAALVDEEFDVVLSLKAFGKTEKFCSGALKANNSVCDLQAGGKIRSVREEINKFIRQNGGARQ